MFINKIKPGNNPPEDINVVIEIPAQSKPIKYELDKETGAIFVDRFVATSMYYPVNYGFVPNTLGLDGDPLDVLVLSEYGLMVGSVINVRPVGVLQMSDESGQDAKIIAVPTSKLTKKYDHIKNTDDIDSLLLEQISHFFTHYKDLEPGKWVKVDKWEDAKTAKQEILDSIKRA